MFRPVVLSVRIPVETRKTVDGVIATCQFLDACGRGRSTDEALASLDGLLTSVFEASFDLGRFDQLFRSAGYSAQADESWPHEGRFIDVRLTLTARHKLLSRTEIDNGIQSALERFAA